MERASFTRFITFLTHENAPKLICSNVEFKFFPGVTPPDPRCGRGRPAPAPTPSTAKGRARSLRDRLSLRHKLCPPQYSKQIDASASVDCKRQPTAIAKKSHYRLAPRSDHSWQIFTNRTLLINTISDCTIVLSTTISNTKKDNCSTNNFIIH